MNDFIPTSHPEDEIPELDGSKLAPDVLSQLSADNRLPDMVMIPALPPELVMVDIPMSLLSSPFFPDLPLPDAEAPENLPPAGFVRLLVRIAQVTHYFPRSLEPAKLGTAIGVILPK